MFRLAFFVVVSFKDRLFETIKTKQKTMKTKKNLYKKLLSLRANEPKTERLLVAPTFYAVVAAAAAAAICC